MLARCNLDRTACQHYDISAGQGALSGLQESVTIDPTTGRILVVTGDQSAASRPALFLLTAW